MRVDFRNIHSTPAPTVPRLMGLFGLGACQAGPYGTLPDGTALCVDTTTGDEVACNDPVCGASAPTTTEPILGPAPPGEITAGCPGTLDSQLYEMAQQMIAMPSTCYESSDGTIETAFSSAAASLCAESGATAAIAGCPPMTCDPASIATLVQQYTAAVTPSCQQFAQTGAWAPNPSSPTTPYTPPYIASPAPITSTPVTSSLVTPPASAGTTNTGSSNTNSSQTSTPTSDWFTEDSLISNVPNWLLLAGGAAVLFLAISMGGKR